MTPRALLTIIGVTAIGFAVAIGSAAGLASSPSTLSTTTTQAHTSVVQRMVSATPSTNLAHLLSSGATGRAASATSDCAIAL